MTNEEYISHLDDLLRTLNVSLQSEVDAGAKRELTQQIAYVRAARRLHSHKTDGQVAPVKWRKGPGFGKWHCCENCTGWPTASYKETNKPGGDVCYQCIAKLNNEQCG